MTDPRLQDRRGPCFAACESGQKDHVRPRPELCSALCVLPHVLWLLRYGLPAGVSPDYLREETTVRVETNFYAASPGDGELIWAGTSDSFSPRSAQKVIDGVVKLIVKELKKQNIL